MHFYPRPPRGGRRLIVFVFLAVTLFLSTPSARRATVYPLFFIFIVLHFYPRPPRGGRQEIESYADECDIISIHALREEGDVQALWNVVISDISIHALREEGDTILDYMGVPTKVFLSTPSARRATLFVVEFAGFVIISIHALREEGDVNSFRLSCCHVISIHALREEGDSKVGGLPLPPPGISIHALREEGDVLYLVCCTSGMKFLSTPSARRATCAGLPPLLSLVFLSTPSARRATRRLSPPVRAAVYFYPRPPRGGRRFFLPIVLF